MDCAAQVDLPPVVIPFPVLVLVRSLPGGAERNPAETTGSLPELALRLKKEFALPEGK